MSGQEQLLDQARAALHAADGAAARRILELVAAGESPPADALDALARAAYIELDYRRAIEEWERAFAAYRTEDNLVAAVQVARMLGFMYGSVIGDPAVMSGWVARAQTIVGESTKSPAAGWAAVSKGMFEGDRTRREELLRRALDIARAAGDADLECLALAYLGASLVHGDRTEEGMVLLDEALAAVAGGEVDDFVAGWEVFCQLFSACEYAHDVTRAEQWIRVGDALADRRKLPAASAFCHTHYGGILTVAGRWPEAELSLTEAIRLWDLGHGAMRVDALVRLADLRVRQGRFEEAEQLLDGIDGDETARPRAAILLAGGETARAREVVERALANADPSSTGAAPLLALLVDVHLAAGDLAEAETAAGELARCAAAHPSNYLRAAAALARARVCLAAGTGDPRACLREALDGFAKAQMPMELARSRLELASSLVEESPQVAMAEARAALEAFDRLQAARDVDAAAAVLRVLGVRPTTAAKTGGLLTKREAEVLDLLGHGLSNPEIADRLYISRKTVEHHVGNILAKLGLRTRTEAATYAVRVKSDAN